MHAYINRSKLRKYLLLLSLILSTALLLFHCMDSLKSYQKLQKTIDLAQNTISLEQRQVRLHLNLNQRYSKEQESPWVSYVRLERASLLQEKNPYCLLFIHGSPGSWTAYRKYMQSPALQELALLISIDRLGYGMSHKEGDYSSLELQARAISAVIEAEQRHFRLRNSANANSSSQLRFVLVGHSLGASIAARAYFDYPDWISALVLIAGSLNPDLERPRWYNHLAKHWPLRWLLGDFWLTSNRELLPLSGDLAQMASKWNLLKCPVLVVHGQRDGLVPFGHLLFLENNIAKEYFNKKIFPKQGHFVLWKRSDAIIEAILGFIQVNKI